MAALMLFPRYLLYFVDRFLFVLMNMYDQLVYNPLQKHLSPIVALIPRSIVIGERKITVFTANGVTLGRTALIVPVAICLKSHYYISASLLIVLHDFLDHVDGIVAKVHRHQYGAVDSPLLGGFLDAFCDKIVNVFTLWTIMLFTDYHDFSWFQLLSFIGICSATIGYEVVLGVVRVQDYFHASYSTSRGKKPTEQSQSRSEVIQASLEGKTKEKLESMSLALFCLALQYDNPMESWMGVAGCVCLAVSVRFAHGSLMHKLTVRSRTVATNKSYTSGHHRTETPLYSRENGCLPVVASAPDLKSMGRHSESDSSSDCEGGEGDSQEVDKVYTVGCFDLFHRGHEKLLKLMRTMGREVIVGIHNDESYFKLKKKRPIDSTERRMENVKKYADQVFVVSSTDPSPYIRCCVHLKPGQRALYVRGDDMPQFPGRSVCEELMPIKLLPYTQGVSSTMLRAELLSGNGTSTDGRCPAQEH